MNNTKTLTAIAAILIAATLVVGGTFAATQSTAFAYQKKGVQANGNSKNANTVTIEKCKQRGLVSGFDNTAEQECQNVICTHPSSTCVSEPGVTPTTTTLLVKKVIVCAGYVACSDLTPADFTITVTGINPDPDSFSGSGTGTLVRLGAGNYTVNETPLNGFTASFSDDCSGTIAPGDQKTCIVTNTEEMIT